MEMNKRLQISIEISERGIPVIIIGSTALLLMSAGSTSMNGDQNKGDLDMAVPPIYWKQLKEIGNLQKNTRLGKYSLTINNGENEVKIDVYNPYEYFKPPPDYTKLNELWNQLPPLKDRINKLGEEVYVPVPLLLVPPKLATNTEKHIKDAAVLFLEFMKTISKIETQMVNDTLEWIKKLTRIY